MVDKDTIKRLCVTCGGKGFYLLMHGFPNKRDLHAKGELVSCNCEDGFKYKTRLRENHGSS